MENFNSKKACLIKKFIFEADGEEEFFNRFDAKQFFSQQKENFLRLVNGVFERNDLTGEDVLAASFSKSFFLRLADVQIYEPVLKKMAVKWLISSNLGVRTNAYLSRGEKNDTGIGLHSDFFPLIVFQVEGSKKWTFYYDDGHREEIEVKKGDFLFVPEKLEHNVTCSDSNYSFHLTMSFDTNTHFEFFTFLFDKMSIGSEFNFDTTTASLKRVLANCNLENEFNNFSKARRLRLINGES